MDGTQTLNAVRHCRFHARGRSWLPPRCAWPEHGHGLAHTNPPAMACRVQGIPPFNGPTPGNSPDAAQNSDITDGTAGESLPGHQSSPWRGEADGDD